MAEHTNPQPSAILAELETAAGHRWGEERRAALRPALERAAAALATVAAFDVPPGVEPFPTGPEAPHG